MTPQKRIQFFLQLSLFSLISFFSVTPKILQTQSFTLTNTYSMGSQRFLSQENLYEQPVPGASFFKHPPFFAMIYSPFSHLSSQTQAILWSLINLVLFWTAIGLWFQLGPVAPKSLWLALIPCFMELNGSLLYQQNDGIVLGLTLIAMALYQKKQYRKAAFTLVVASNFGIFGALFMVLLLFNRKPVYFFSVALGLFVTCFSPLLFTKASSLMEWQLDWYALLLNEANRVGSMDIATALSKYGYPITGLYLRLVVIFLSIVLMGLVVWQQRPIPWHDWFTVGCCFLLLTNPRSEAQDFIWVAPCYLFLAEKWTRIGSPTARQVFGTLWVSSAILVTFLYNDLWPHFLWNPSKHSNLTKIGGTMIMLSLGYYFLFQCFLKRNLPQLKLTWNKLLYPDMQLG